MRGAMAKKPTVRTTTIPLRGPLFRGERRLRIALVGLPGSGKSSLFSAVSSTSVQTAALAGTQRAYDECAVQIGLDEARVINLPSVRSLRHAEDDDRATLKYLLWGDERPSVTAHEPQGPPAPFAPPDVIVQVADATMLERHLELTLELAQLARPLVVALNKMDEAQDRGLYVNGAVLAAELGVPVVPTVAVMGHGISELFRTAVDVVRDGARPRPQPASRHIAERLQPLAALLGAAEIQAAFRVPLQLLITHVAEGDRYFADELAQHFPDRLPEVRRLLAAAAQTLPRPLPDELHADRHHRAALLYEAATSLGPRHAGRGWRRWLDEMFLSPRWGFVGSIAVFAAVLFVVFYVSTWIDAATTARLVAAVSGWQPESAWGVVARAVADAGAAGARCPARRDRAPFA